MPLSRTPLAPDPGYEHTCNFYPKGAPSDPTPQGRVRPEAVDIARLHTRGSVSMLLQLQEEPQLYSRYKRPETKNHSRENYRRIRQIQEKRKQREEEVVKPVKPVYIKSDKYDHVQPKVTVYTQHSRPYTASSLPSPPPKSTHAPSPVSQLEPPRVPVNGTPVNGPHTTQSREKRTKNFLAANIASAAKHQVRKPPSVAQLDSLHSRRRREMEAYHRGEVPDYLKQRQAEWHKEEEERLASLPDPSVPPGHTLMSTEEKKRTLDVLREHQGVLTQELLSLPLHSDTLRVRGRRSELEARLAEIDDAIKIFSRPKVFVKLDE